MIRYLFSSLSILSIQFWILASSQAATLLPLKQNLSDIALIEGDRFIQGNDLSRRHQLNTNDIVITGLQSSLKIELKGNGSLFLAPASELIYRGQRDDGIQLFSLLSGEVFFTTYNQDKGLIATRDPGAIINIRDYTVGHHGERFRLVYRENEKKIENLASKIHLLNLEEYEYTRLEYDSE